MVNLMRLFHFICFTLLALRATLTNGQLLYEPLIQLPGIQQFENPNSILVISVSGFGAKGDGITDDTQAFRDAWRTVCLAPSSKAVLEIPAGNTYLVGPIDFAGPCRTSVILRIYGSVTAPSDPVVWEGLNPRKWLYFHQVKNLRVEGGGEINGMGEAWWSRSCKVNTSNVCEEAPTAITFHRCNNLILRNLKMANSQQMHIAFTNCEDVTVTKLEVNAPATSPNTDAIHISSSNDVLVKHSTISTGDDCISIVGNSSEIEIRNITCTAGHGISIGSLGKENAHCKVKDVLVEKVFLSNTKNGLRIKTWQGGSGYASHIRFYNVLMENVSNPILIDQYYCDSQVPCPNQTLAVKVRDISYRHITGTSATEEAIRFACSDTLPCREIDLASISLTSSTGGITSTYCWNARGSYEGRVIPPPCIPFFDGIMEQKVTPSDENYASYASSS